MTNNDLRTNNFDLVRLFACLQVAVLHAGHYLQVERGPVLQGVFDTLDYFPGVNVLFMVSGFLIAMSYDRRPYLGSYARNRFLRIYPALFVAFVATLVALACFGFLRPSASFAAWAAAQLTVGQWYNPSMFREFGMGNVNPSLWAISIEIQWYVFCPLLVFATRRLKSRTRENLLYALLIVASAGLAHVLGREGLIERARWAKLASVSLAPFLFVILMGTAAYRNFDVVRRLVEGKFVLWTILYLGFRVIAGRVLSIDVDGSAVLLPVSRLLLALWALSLAFTWRGLSGRLLRGQDVSYGTYLYHMLVVNVMIELGFVKARLCFLGAIAISLAVASVSWVLVERPALRLKRHALRPVAERVDG